MLKATTKLLFLFYVYALLMPNANAELSGLINILQYVGIISNVTIDPDLLLPLTELGQSRGQTHNYNYHSIALHWRSQHCDLDDYRILHLLRKQNNEPIRKPPLMVKCLQPDVDNVNDNSTRLEKSLLMMQSLKDIATLLKPIGNATKRHEPGSCVVILFCTPTSLGCAAVAPVANALPHFFPTLRIAHIDAFQFPGFNAEFGVVGLPTLMLFHQGRPIVKYYFEDQTYTDFITRHTGIRPMKPVLGMEEINGPLPVTPVEATDYYLFFAWNFIALCLLNHLRSTNWWKQIVEMVQRNWRDSEETQMELAD